MLEKNFQPHALEAKLYQMWEDQGLFSYEKESGKPAYCIMMPPPNVTGSLHMGHALDYTLQDILVRLHRMKGFNVLWQPGVDHAGIATQMVVERNLLKEGITRQNLGREKFLEKVWAWKEESGDTIVKQQRRLGIAADWSRHRFTMDERLSKAVIEVFVKLYDDGLIYRDKRLVNWDPKLLTAVSDLEVINTEGEGQMYYISYPLKDDPTQAIVVATTRPETLFGDQAVAVNPGDERYQKWIGREVVLPFVNRPIPVIADDHADPEKQTGAVKITPGHDFNDFEVGKRHNLAFETILTPEAHLVDCLPQPFAGMERFKARALIIEKLEEMGQLVKVETITNAVPYGERSGVVLEPRLTDQWFMNTTDLSAKALKAVEDGETKFIPENYISTYRHWMTNIQPWCISRQLWWGHRIPAWYGPDEKIFVAKSEDEALSKATAHYGKTVELRQEDDVLDTWFSSGLWPFSTLGWPDKTPELQTFYPTSVLVTGTDILFFWVARMMMMGLYVTGQVPFKNVLLHALVRDEKGQKMSKSKGNVVDPLQVMDVHGSDALRFTMAALSSPGRDIRFSPKNVELYRNFGTKIWNAAKFCEHHGIGIVKDLALETITQPINRWCVMETISMLEALNNAFDVCRFDEGAHTLYQYIWGTICDWFIELSKPVLEGPDGDLKTETKQTLGWALGMICRTLHPIMPFLTEELWQNIGPKGSILMAETWPTLTLESKDQGAFKKAHDQVAMMIDLVTRVRGVRMEVNVPAGAFVDLIFKTQDQAQIETLQLLDTYIKKAARVKEMTFDAAVTPAGKAQCVVGDLLVLIPLGDVIDIALEKERLSKSLEKVKKEWQSLTHKLSNGEFVKNAPPEIIQKNQERLEEEGRQMAKLQEALTLLDQA